MAALIRDYGDDTHPRHVHLGTTPIRGGLAPPAGCLHRQTGLQLGTNWRVLPHHWHTRSTWAVSRPAPPRCTPAKFFRKGCASHRSSFMSRENQPHLLQTYGKEHPYSGQAGRGYAGTGRGLPNRRYRTDQPDRAIRQRHLPQIVEELHDHAERIMRTEISALPDGTWSFTDYIDGLGGSTEPFCSRSPLQSMAAT